jgi:predicted SAM-dependent methyltransferase
VLYTYETLVKIFRDAGFEVRLLEYFDEAGNFDANVFKIG